MTINNILEMDINELSKIKFISNYIFDLANKVLLDVISNYKNESWIEDRYKIVEKLWKNGKTGINIMRIDFGKDLYGNLKALELNTVSQSGWFTKYDNISKNEDLFYEKYLMNKLGNKIIFIIRKDGHYKSVKINIENIEKMGGIVKVIYFENININDIINFFPTGIYLKCSRVPMDIYDIIYKISLLKIPQIPSYEAMFISGDKSFLNLLKKYDKHNCIAETYIIDKNDINKNLNILKKDKSILKPGELSRGRNIEFGEDYDEKKWKDKILEIMKKEDNWVLQELCYLETKNLKYQDITVFVIDGEVKMLGSRISDNKIINVAQNGSFQTIILKQ